MFHKTSYFMKSNMQQIFTFKISSILVDIVIKKLKLYATKYLDKK